VKRNQSLSDAPPIADGAKAQATLMRRLWRDHVREHVPLLLVAAVFMTLEGASFGAFAWLVRPLFDELFTEGSMDGVIWVASLITMLFIVRALSGFVQRLIVVRVGLRVTNSLQSRLVNHMLSLDLRFFLDNAPGALIERVRGDTSALQKLASSTLISVGRDTFTLLSLLVVMIATDWFWTLSALIGIPLLVVPLALVQRYIRTTTRTSREASARLSTRLDEIFHGIQTIKLNRLEPSEDERFRRELKRFIRPAMRAQVGQAANPALMDLIAAAGFAMVLWLGGQQIISGEKSLGEFMSFFTALGLMFEPLRRLSNVAGQIQAGLASLERVYTAIDAPPTIVSPQNPEPLRNGDIAFQDVHFGYDDQPVLRGLDFVARAGETTALVGPSGAGKTTIFALLTRLADPGQGRVSIDGVAVDRIDLRELRDNIAVVSQDSALFDETIADNIAMGREKATPEDLRQAAQDASVLDFADKLEHGLDTPVGPRGSNLSGGQRQRVTIARAMLKAAPILLLDEPTSALDARSEQLVQQALDRLAIGRTTLVIAHRLSTVRTAAKIVVMESGRVVEEGTHDALLAAKGAYARMHRLQASGEADEGAA